MSIELLPKNNINEDDNLDIIFSDLFVFVENLISGYGEPHRPSQESIKKLFRQIKTNPLDKSIHLPKRFYLAERVAGEILFSHNVHEYLGLPKEFDLLKFHSRITDGEPGWNPLKEYLDWGKIAYLFFEKIGKEDNLYNYAFKIKLPMKMADGEIYWVFQESHPLELDANNNMLSHLNTYTVGAQFRAEDCIPIRGQFFCNNTNCTDWNSLIETSRHFVMPFILQPIQIEIVKYFYQNPNNTLYQCSEELRHPVNTLKKYISDCRYKRGIIDKARYAFPHVTLKKMKDVVAHLTKIGWMAEW